jgi:hypothetical protein
MTLIDADVSRETNNAPSDEYGDTVIADVSRETNSEFEGPTPGTKTADPTAPYGFTRDGKVRGRPGRRPGKVYTTNKTTPPAPKKAANGPTKAAPKTTQIDYRPALMALSGEVIGTIAVTGLMRNSVTTVANAAALAGGQSALVNLTNNLGNQFAVVGAILDKLLTIGPYASDGATVLLMLAQLLVNQRIMPVGLVPGTKTPEALMAEFVERQLQESESFRAAFEFIAAQRQQAQQDAP